MLMNRAITIASLVGGMLAIVISLGLGSPLFAALSAGLFCLSLGFWRYGYLVFPAIAKAGNITENRSGYEIPSTRDYIMKKCDSGYYASKFLEIRFYESSLDKGEEQKTSMFEAFERAISSLKYIVKISLLISAVDLSKHIEDIKTKRSSAEGRKSKYARENSDEAVMLDREIAKWNRLLDRITHGERPVELVAFASTTAFGLTREEAVTKAKRQAKELKTILSSSLSSDVVELVDLDMLRCFDWEMFLPSTTEELRDEVF